MKLYYGIASAALLLLAIAFGAWHLRHAPLPPDKALSKTPKESETVYAAAKALDRGASMPDIKAIWERNPFDPARGAADRPEDGGAPAKRADLELVGICKFGDQSGAIIVNKSSPSPAPPGQPGGGQPGKAEKRFYSLGQRMANGYLLKEIGSDHVVLARGNEEISLKLQFGDDGSSRRIASVAVKPLPKDEPAASAAEQGEPPKASSEPDAGAKGQDKPKGLPKPPSPPPMGIPKKLT